MSAPKFVSLEQDHVDLHLTIRIQFSLRKVQLMNYFKLNELKSSNNRECFDNL